MSFKSNYQISQIFTIRKLTKHQSKSLIPAGEVLHIFIILGDYAVKLTSIQK